MRPQAKPSMKKLGSLQPVKIKSASASLVRTQPLHPGCALPLLIQATVAGLKLEKWCAGNKDFLEEKLLEHGAVLFRNFIVGSANEFEGVIEAVSGSLLKYTYQSTPRTRVEGKIYTSTEYPPDQSIPMHNEMSYSRSWPLKLWFFCKKAAPEGGHTPLADSRKVYENIDPEVRECFRRRRVMYVRNYGTTLDLPWQQVFQTEEKGEVERFCRGAGIEIEWRDGDRLKTWQICQAVADHPKLGTRLWFNQAHLFHVSSLQAEIRESLLASISEEELPRNSFYGDGSSIETGVLDHIRRVYDEQQARFPWQDNDVVLVDNMLTAHGRTPYSGSRNVLVGMAEPYEA